MLRVLKYVLLFVSTSFISSYTFMIKEFDEKNLELAEFVFDISGTKEPECIRKEKQNEHIVQISLSDQMLTQNQLNEIEKYAENKGLSFKVEKENGLYLLQFSYNPHSFHMSCDQRENREEKKQLVITLYNKHMLDKLHKEQPLLRLTYLGVPSKAC